MTEKQCTTSFLDVSNRDLFSLFIRGQINYQKRYSCYSNEYITKLTRLFSFHYKIEYIVIKQIYQLKSFQNLTFNKRCEKISCTKFKRSLILKFVNLTDWGCQKYKTSLSVETYFMLEIIQ